jgi:hypothetical protein
VASKKTWEGTVHVEFSIALWGVPASNPKIATKRMVEMAQAIAEHFPKKVKIKGAPPIEVYGEVSDLVVEPDGWGAECEQD